MITRITKIFAISLMAYSIHVGATDAPLSSSAPTSGGLAGLFGKEQKSKFLPVHQAFKVTSSQKGDKLTVSFNVTPEHYIYQDKLGITLPDGVTASPWQFSITPSMVDDPEFGRVAVFERHFTATTTLSAQASVENVPVSIKWQGCATAGLCYPPETTKATISLMPKPTPKSATNARTHTSDTPKATPPVTSQARTQSYALTDSTTKSAGDELGASTSVPVATYSHELDGASSSPLVTVLPSTPTQDISTMAGMEGTPSAMSDDASSHTPDGTPAVMGQAVPTATADDERHKSLQGSSDPFGIQKNPVTALFLLFMAGLLLSFTPCVYPMIPIVANIVARQKHASSARGFALSASYGLGVATAYGVLGAVVAWFGRALGITGWLQNPYVLIIFAIIFTVLAVAMFDLVQLRLPAFISTRLQRQSQAADGRLGSIGSSFMAGGLSALVVSPCVSLPMAGALTAVSVSGSVLVGFFALFLFGLGLSVPLMLLGAVQGKFMPQAGAWMSHVKAFCALLLLAVAVSLVERVWLSPAMLVLWAGWFMLFAVWCFRLGRLLPQAMSAVSAIWAVCLMVGAAMGQTDAWRPLAALQGGTAPVSMYAAAKPDIKIKTLSELDAVLLAHDKVLVDVTADWCIECRIMERTLFTNRPTQLGGYQVVKLDVTETNDDSRAILSRYQLFGPPALLLYKDGQLHDVLLGEVKRADFEQALEKL